MRVILGSAQRAKLKSPQGDAVRPTSDLVKEAVFNVLQFDLEGRRVLDLFAGSGQLGIEALSRGAAHAVFVDAAASSLDIVRQNLAATNLAASATVVRSDYQAYLTTCRETFDLVFLDPPYAAGYLADALHRVANRLSAHGVVVCEHPVSLALPEQVGTLSCRRRYRYGKTMTSFYDKGETSA